MSNPNRIRHFTKNRWVTSILESGIIYKEGETSGNPPIGFPPAVWLTSSMKCNTADYLDVNRVEVYFEFDVKATNAKKWHFYKKELKDPFASGLAKQMDKLAREKGDDPYNYWVSFDRLYLADCVAIKHLNNPDFDNRILDGWDTLMETWQEAKAADLQALAA